MVYWVPQFGHVQLDVSVSGMASFLFLTFFGCRGCDVGRAGHVFPLLPAWYLTAGSLHSRR